MSTAYIEYPQLSPEQLQKIQALERELGTIVVAVKPQASVADLPPDKLKRLREVEDEMGVILLAYDETRTR